VTARHQPVRRGVGVVVDVDANSPAQVGPDDEVGPCVGVDSLQAVRTVGVESLDRAAGRPVEQRPADAHTLGRDGDPDGAVPEQQRSDQQRDQGGDTPHDCRGNGDREGQPQAEHEGGREQPPGHGDRQAFGVGHARQGGTQGTNATGRVGQRDAAMTPPRQVEVLIRRLDPDLPVPSYAHPGDAGADLMAAVDVDLAPGERAVVPTGIALALPDGYVALVHPRSGLAARCGVTIVNAPGTIDAGYRGEVKVVLANLDPNQPVSLRRGDRIAQLVFQPVERARFVEVERLPGSDRGDGGYGSTGGIAAQARPVGEGL
jgi:dUTP pyrophosphatase